MISSEELPELLKKGDQQWQSARRHGRHELQSVTGKVPPDTFPSLTMDTKSRTKFQGNNAVEHLEGVIKSKDFLGHVHHTVLRQEYLAVGVDEESSEKKIPDEEGNDIDALSN
jgi:hypothetical protein